MKLRIILTPLEPYFFGNDRSFSYGLSKVQKAGGYYMASEYIPSQTTLFGALRYLGIQTKNKNYSLSEEDQKNIGSKSFELTDEDVDYGRIEKISPLYIMDHQGNYFVKTPFDHLDDSKNQGPNIYKPFKNYQEVETTEGIKILPVEFKAKDYSTGSYMNIKSYEIFELDHIFQSTVRVGIDKKRLRKNGSDEDRGSAFVKREFRYMKDHSFVFFASVSEGFPLTKDKLIYLGQGKSAFLVKVDIEPQPCLDQLLETHNQKIVYAVSDLYVKEHKRIYDASRFTATKVRNHRTFITNYEKGAVQVRRFLKREHSISLIEAGSIFIIEDQNKMETIIGNPHAEIAGFNVVVYGGKK